MRTLLRSKLGAHVRSKLGAKVFRREDQITVEGSLIVTGIFPNFGGKACGNKAFYSEYHGQWFPAHQLLGLPHNWNDLIEHAGKRYAATAHGIYEYDPMDETPAWAEIRSGNYYQLLVCGSNLVAVGTDIAEFNGSTWSVIDPPDVMTPEGSAWNDWNGYLYSFSGDSNLYALARQRVFWYDGSDWDATIGVPGGSLYDEIVLDFGEPDINSVDFGYYRDNSGTISFSITPERYLMLKKSDEFYICGQIRLRSESGNFDSYFFKWSGQKITEEIESNCELVGAAPVTDGDFVGPNDVVNGLFDINGDLIVTGSFTAANTGALPACDEAPLFKENYLGGIAKLNGTSFDDFDMGIRTFQSNHITKVNVVFDDSANTGLLVGSKNGTQAGFSSPCPQVGADAVTLNFFVWYDNSFDTGWDKFPNQADTVIITDPDNMETVSNPVTLTAVAADVFANDISARIEWRSLDESDVSEMLGTGDEIVDTFSPGDYAITASIDYNANNAGNGAFSPIDVSYTSVERIFRFPFAAKFFKSSIFGDQDTINITVQSGGLPTVTITSPSDSASVSNPVTFTGTASDPEDGDISENIVWSSRVDGFLGIGSSINVNLSIGAHQIHADIMDSDENEDRDTINITVTA